MKSSIRKTDFFFMPSGHGHYVVTYTSPVTNKMWTKTIDNMQLIDATKNSSDPKKIDLEILKKLCKS
jgi:hypothetical protein